MRDKIQSIQATLNKVILGKESQVELAVICLLAKGHILIEDLPGMGKTTLAHAISRVFGLEFQRIQFTSDLLPADITGSAIYDKNTQAFTFHPGPIFSQVVLADEINRATPKSQSALLEAMEEHQVTIEGETRNLPEPFFVIATQNPSHQLGTYPLPESQLDRFLLRLSLGYPHPEIEKSLLLNGENRSFANTVQAQMAPEELVSIQSTIKNIPLSDSVADYLLKLVVQTRQSPELVHGVSPRAGLALSQASKAHAWLQSRDYVIPEDVQRVFVPVVGHRLMTSGSSQLDGNDVAESILQNTAVPH
ncbi:AAA family ATPase [Pleionea sediminis]|uniref:AAA family ATPase n=1 Tax=Pleionea sediminis TaxID=2569479 RepID=UPI001184C9A2|nr:MoxR family ATPase [Pleionea sediminis]